MQKLYQSKIGIHFRYLPKILILTHFSRENLRFTQHDLRSDYNPSIPLVVKTLYLEHNWSLKRLFEVYLAQVRDVFFENFNFSYENLEIVSIVYNYDLLSFLTSYLELIIGAAKRLWLCNYFFLQEINIQLLFSDRTLLSFIN